MMVCFFLTMHVGTSSLCNACTRWPKSLISSNFSCLSGSKEQWLRTASNKHLYIRACAGLRRTFRELVYMHLLVNFWAHTSFMFSFQILKEHAFEHFFLKRVESFGHALFRTCGHGQWWHVFSDKACWNVVIVQNLHRLTKSLISSNVSHFSFHQGSMIENRVRHALVHQGVRADWCW